MTIFIVEFWRRSIDRIEYSSNKVFSEEFRAKKHLRLNGYRQIDDLTFERGSMRAIITERMVL